MCCRLRGGGSLDLRTPAPRPRPSPPAQLANWPTGLRCAQPITKGDGERGRKNEPGGKRATLGGTGRSLRAPLALRGVELHLGTIPARGTASSTSPRQGIPAACGRASGPRLGGVKWVPETPRKAKGTVGGEGEAHCTNLIHPLRPSARNRPRPSPTHAQRISPLSYHGIGWLLMPQIPRDWLGLQIKHCLPIIKLISDNINAHRFLFLGYNMKRSLSSFLLTLSLSKRENLKRKKKPKMGLLNSKSSKVKQAQILLLGLDSAGKSTLLYRLKLAHSIVTIPTIGFNVEMIELEKSLSLTVWDIGGQEKMRAVWDYYCENTDGLVYVVDSTDKWRLEDSRREFEHILKNEHIKNVPVVLLANKQDMNGALTAEDITRIFKVKKLCSDRNWYVQPCCAITGEGLPEGFRKLTEFVKRHLKSREDTFAFFKQN
ncbi:ADP-ribosylation factor-like protein 14 [Trichechus manatus latirostris]|uniref:ADP-ribosylation factor-like protein 14 n=1 Tax=Trichechus manatus latirostris TaxID=127582 RepID=A0A2Y9DQM4_TRIMA|nr:ADP-ribosylation factor-like protein 14 [Trichechus manatus latirostris]